MELIARGRDADVYALDGARVLRRYRDGAPTRLEARLMTHLAACGYPVPQVHEVTDTDLVLERLTRPTMTEALGRTPWRVGAFGRMPGGLHDRLHDRLHAIPAPSWLPARFPAAGAGAGQGRVPHLDLHPSNVITTAAGPVVIDWRNAAAGDPAADLAMTLVTVGSAEVPGPAARFGRGLLLRAARRGSGTDPGPRLQEPIAAKLADPDLTPREAAWPHARLDAPVNS
ncbi:aminoglycoside phosphotransferase family protein [Kitasatospora sp. NBC_00240]|uniref:phosphotransferase n=1 Tax=Kitasatospora sp. NBC_00240 TaxID=2903567 RepID=UPI002252764F|nr:aminoglycoside phosphotransferase family protein [Kitasatospora sp. NBC_00240]MCX5209913.1 aminoglycoside phosphotransferase family protein [Kitasatospora sp. NBC_00240]